MRERRIPTVVDNGGPRESTTRGKGGDYLKWRANTCSADERPVLLNPAKSAVIVMVGFGSLTQLESRTTGDVDAMSEWTTDTLKEYFERIFLEKQIGLDAALVSLKDHLKQLNELRSGVATKDQLDALDARLRIVEDAIRMVAATKASLEAVDSRLKIVEDNQKAIAQQKLGRGSIVAYGVAAISAIGLVVVLANMYLGG